MGIFVPKITFQVPHFKSIKAFFTAVILCLLFSSCFKDVDFGQAEDITLEPDLEVDLLYYQLDETDFQDSQTNEYTPIIRDTVRLEFLDDDYIQDGLTYAAFRFKHQNYFSQDIRSNIRFLGANGRNQFNITYIIPAASEGSPSVIDTTHVMEGGDISKVKRSIQMLVELEMLEGGKDRDGSLEFQSKGLFKFEF